MEKIDKKKSNLNKFEDLKNDLNKTVDKKELSKNKLSILKDAIINNNENLIIQNIEKYEKSEFFHKKTLKKWELLFDEWDIDKNLYIIKSGRLSVQKYTNKEKTKIKDLAVLLSWDFFWEWSLKNDNLAKQTRILAQAKTELIAINWKEWLKWYIKENPEAGTELLIHIIDKTNNRLNEVNSQISINYEIETSIRELKEINLWWLIYLLEKVNSLLNSDYIIYIEKHPVVENYFSLKYDSRISQKILNTWFEAEKWLIDLDLLYNIANISQEDEITINKVNLWEEILWYIIIWKKKRIWNESEKITCKSIANSLSWVIKQIFINRDEKEILSLKNAKMEY